MNAPPLPDDASELERRLIAWVPATAGLDADAMLFAAGRASAKRIPWGTVCVAGLVVVLGAWLVVERTERLRLERSPAVSAPAPATAAEWPPTSYGAARSALTSDLDAWPPQAIPDAAPPGAPEQPALRVRGFDDLLAK